jgi:hypothetical protein
VSEKLHCRARLSLVHIGKVTRVNLDCGFSRPMATEATWATARGGHPRARTSSSPAPPCSVSNTRGQQRPSPTTRSPRIPVGRKRFAEAMKCTGSCENRCNFGVALSGVCAIEAIPTAPYSPNRGLLDCGRSVTLYIVGNHLHTSGPRKLISTNIPGQSPVNILYLTMSRSRLLTEIRHDGHSHVTKISRLGACTDQHAGSQRYSGVCTEQFHEFFLVFQLDCENLALVAARVIAFK